MGGGVYIGGGCGKASGVEAGEDAVMLEAGRVFLREGRCEGMLRESGTEPWSRVSRGGAGSWGWEKTQGAKTEAGGPRNELFIPQQVGILSQGGTSSEQKHSESFCVTSFRYIEEIVQSQRELQEHPASNEIALISMGRRLYNSSCSAEF